MLSTLILFSKIIVSQTFGQLKLLFSTHLSTMSLVPLHTEMSSTQWQQIYDHVQAIQKEVIDIITSSSNTSDDIR